MLFWGGRNFQKASSKNVKPYKIYFETFRHFLINNFSGFSSNLIGKTT